MKRKQLTIGWLAGVCLTLLMLTLAGCAGSDTTPLATKTTASGTMNTTTGTTAAVVPVTAPTGVTLSIPAGTVLTDGSGNPVTGDITTTVGYSTTTADLPTAASTLPAGSTLATFVDISMGTVKHFSNPLTIAINVASSGAKAGDAITVYSFDSGTNLWTYAGTEIVDTNGNISPTVTHLSIWGLFKSSTPPPVKPTGVQAAAGNSQATVSWSAVTGATSYTIYYGTTAGVTTSSITKAAGATSPQVITGLTNGTPYYFVVTALNAAGESVVSSQVSTTPVPPAPAKPSGIGASAGDGQVTVSWTVVAATTYNIYYSTTAGVTTATGTKVANVTSPYVVTPLTNGTPYYFVVTAVNAGGESGISSEKSATPLPAQQVPTNPTGRAATSTVAGQATVSWNVVTGATSYNIYYLKSATAPATTNTVISTGTKVSNAVSPQVLTGLPSGTYYFQITAVNAAGEGPSQPNVMNPGLLVQ